MVFAFSPKSDQEIDAIQNRGLLADGIYPFQVAEIISRTSKSNNPMLEVKLKVRDGNDVRLITDYLLTSDTMIFKLKHFCEAIGLLPEYEKGQLDPKACLNRSGSVKIGTQKGNPKPDGGFYPDKNNVKDYAKASASHAKPVAAVPAADAAMSDDVPW